MNRINNVSTQFYVYTLLDETSIPFYVGKGINSRALQHFHDWSLQIDSLKNNKIKAIKEKTGKWPAIQIVESKITSSKALVLEEALIKQYGRIDLGTGILTNKTDGGQSGNNRLRSISWRQKHSKKIEGKKFTEQHRKNLAKANRDRTKGKKLEEIYGVQEATRLQKIQKNNLMKRGMTWKQRYGKEKAAQLMAKRAANIGKTWEEIYGLEGAKQRRLAFKQRANSRLLLESVT